MSTTTEISLKVPAELVLHCPGLALDMGGSVIKVIYRSSENAKEIENGESKYGHLQLASFPRHDMEAAMEFVKEHAHISRDGTPPTIITTGVGCTEFGKIICDRLSVQLKQVTEFDCFVNSFIYLASHLSRTDLLEPQETGSIAEVVRQMKSTMTILQAMKTEDLTQNEFGSPHADELTQFLDQSPIESDAPLSEAEDDVFPCILAMLGSGFGYMQVNKDGTFKLLDGSNRGGRAFFGIGRLLTNCKNYDELAELASQGNSREVDFFSSDFFTSDPHLAEGDTSMYAKAMDITSENSMLIYCFGKCTDFKKDVSDFRREDRAAALLKYLVLDIVQCLQLTCFLHDIKRIFFCGSFCNTDLVRKSLTSEMTRRSIGRIMYGAKPDYPLKIDFVKPGGHLGALGALIQCLDNKR